MTFSIPTSFDSFDFSYPIGACGNSSGWVRGFDLAKFPEYSTRRRTELVEIGRSVFFRMISGGFDEVDPSAAREFVFGVKAKLGSGGVPALSSGGGSALFRRGDRTYKIKRAGIADDGFLPQRLSAHSTVIEGGEIYEVTREAIPGLTELTTAMSECMINEKMRSLGLCTAYRPVGVLVVKDLPGDPRPDLRLGAVITEVSSDLRMDEVVHMSLSPILAWLHGEKLLSVDHGYHSYGAFRCERVPLRATLARFEHVFARLETLGRAAGGIYRRLHEAGYERGLGSSWFGNEVIEKDGRVSLVDFDGGMGDASPSGLKARCQRMELLKYLAESHMLLTDMHPRATQAFAVSFFDGVLRGYDEAWAQRIPEDMLRGIVGDHLQAFPAIRALYNFPDDSVLESN